MAIKTGKTTEKDKTILVKPREIFKQELLGRITLGERLSGKEIKNTEQLDDYNNNFSDWDDYNKELIKRAFNNPESEYYFEYSKVNEMEGVADVLRGVNTDHPVYKAKMAKKEFENCLTILKRLVEKLPLIEEKDHIHSYQTQERVFSNCGFIVHGHNDIKKLEVARFIENELKLKAIILHEQPNRGKTIMEKFEHYSIVDFAVSIWTADDDGKGKKENELKDRARQNVIFETGFFIGKLGRENVIVLYENGVEIPSDYSGVIFIPLADNWKDDLRKEINSIYSHIS